MKKLRWICLMLATAAAARGAGDLLDRLDRSLEFASPGGMLLAHVSGTMDVEGYRLPQPSPGLLFTDGNGLFNGRLSLFADGQAGPGVYFFTQVRVDRGFDPASARPRARIDEYAVRFKLSTRGRLNLQLGKFATAVGNWTQRHGSWDNPFVGAPLPYEQLTGIWDRIAARNSRQLLAWAHVAPGAPGVEQAEKTLRTPIIWGPAYASGAAISGTTGVFDYAVELKNTAPAAHPGSWDPESDPWRHPGLDARVGYRPGPMWSFGVSAAVGPYLKPSASPTMAAGDSIGDYRETVFAQDAAFAWHHWQVWAEYYSARFSIPAVGPARTRAAYLETKYRFTPRFSLSARWNRQVFGRIPDGAGGMAGWGRNVWRLDVAPGIRLSPHVQLKLQLSRLYDRTGPNPVSNVVASQVTVRF